MLLNQLNASFCTCHGWEAGTPPPEALGSKGSLSEHTSVALVGWGGMAGSQCLENISNIAEAYHISALHVPSANGKGCLCKEIF